MVYQAPRQKCLQNWPKSGVFDPLNVHESVGRPLGWRNLPGNADLSDSTRCNANDQATL